MNYLPNTPSSYIFWTCVGGAFTAGVNHYLNDVETIKEYTPVAYQNHKLSPEAKWWGGRAFSAVNLGYATVGLWIGLKSRDEIGKQAYMLGTGVMFWLFSMFWLRDGDITGKKDYEGQSLKIFFMGAVFVGGFIASYFYQK